MIFVIERIRTKKGEEHERESRRKGHRVLIEEIAVGAPLFAKYMDDVGKALFTTPVEAYNTDWREDGYLIVQTRNSVYSFRQEKDVEAA